jgi:hypothetical protein
MAAALLHVGCCCRMYGRLLPRQRVMAECGRVQAQSSLQRTFERISGLVRWVFTSLQQKALSEAILGFKQEILSY